METFDYARVLASLLLVLGAIWAAAFALRRSGLAKPGEHGPLRVVQTLPLGARERLVVLGAGEEQLVLAVTPQGVSRVGTLPASPEREPDTPGALPGTGAPEPAARADAGSPGSAP